MSLPRLNRQTCSFFVAQCLDANDILGNPYDETSLPIMVAARFTTAYDSDGFPFFQTVAGTDGPMAGWVIWPSAGSRTLAQTQAAFVAKITSTGKATPVQTPGNTDPGLGELAVVGPDNAAAPGVGTYGIVMVGSDLHSQTPIFFAGGGAPAVYLVQSGSNPYTVQQYTYPGGTTIGLPVSAKEFSSSTKVPGGVGLYVPGWTLGDGNLWIWAPYGC
jgi:hypothetical protein